MQAPAAAGNLALENLLLWNRPGGACSSAWLEPAAHNGLVAGSNPAGPTNDFNGLSVFFPRTLFFAARKRHAKARFRVAIKRHFGP